MRITSDESSCCVANTQGQKLQLKNTIGVASKLAKCTSTSMILETQNARQNAYFDN